MKGKVVLGLVLVLVVLVISGCTNIGISSPLKNPNEPSANLEVIGVPKLNNTVELVLKLNNVSIDYFKNKENASTSAYFKIYEGNLIVLGESEWINISPKTDKISTKVILNETGDVTILFHIIIHYYHYYK